MEEELAYIKSLGNVSYEIKQQKLIIFREKKTTVIEEVVEEGRSKRCCGQQKDADVDQLQCSNRVRTDSNTEFIIGKWFFGICTRD